MIGEADLQAVYDFIRAYQTEHSRPPTYQDITDACHMSSGYARRCLDWLDGQGRITRTAGRKRTVVAVVPAAGD